MLSLDCKSPRLQSKARNINNKSESRSCRVVARLYQHQPQPGCCRQAVRAFTCSQPTTASSLDLIIANCTFTEKCWTIKPECHPAHARLTTSLRRLQSVPRRYVHLPIPPPKLASARNTTDTLIQSVVYGKCIFADYNNVHKDKCKTEFMRLKDCYLVSFCDCLTLCAPPPNQHTESVQNKVAKDASQNKKYS